MGDAELAGEGAGTRLRTWVGHWELWSGPRGVPAIFLVVEGLAAAVAVIALLRSNYGITEFVRFGSLLGLAFVQAELSRSVERLRRTLCDRPHINMTSVWTFAGVLVLPSGLAVTLGLLIYLHLWLRVWRGMSHRPAYRVVYCAAAIVLSCLASGVIVAGWNGLPVGFTGSLRIVEAAAVFTAANAFIVALSVYLHTGGRSPRSLFGTGDDNLLEVTTLVLGTSTALGIVHAPALVPFVLLPVLVLHRSVLVRQLEIAANIDGKTGVLNAHAWHLLSERALSSAARTKSKLGVLMLDLDHFKQVNDVYGHLAGDVVLKAVATTISEHVRDYDSVGRFGGEEFVVLLPGATETEVIPVAERVRQAVMALEVEVATASGPRIVRGLSVSIGVAVYPSGGTVLERLLHVADTALYQAKNSGRNRVVSFAAA
ncbi:GGDEF domain-containing protein [Amycolatopsis regifaucium]|uniref:GGDEF domain-containing protein n=1 Tax=Amycolatopsis regifaucium TaxID=546365 RepID=A0ABX3DP84_9PSEU|nr:GGDEF domain-containing protein [Amycolatopsis regifaucium]